MKQKDIAVIIAVVATSAVLSLVIANTLFAGPQKHQLKSQVVEKINTDFDRPDAKYFNNQSLNPTKQIKIGEDPNTKPFNSPTP